MKTESRAADVADRLWRAYAPFQRGRSTSGDLTSMLAILVLAQFVESVGEPTDEFVDRWGRAVAEAGIGISPLVDLRAALLSAGADKRFPLSDLRDLNVGFLGSDASSDDVPWSTTFVAALDLRPMLAAAECSDVCDLLLERHVQEGAVSGGEFHTPRAITRLLVEMAAVRPGDRILDPACGSGGFLAAAARRITTTDRVNGASFEAYATDRSNPPLAMMNLAIHGVDRPVVRASDPMSQFRNRGNGLFDVVLGNPPFNQRIEDAGGAGWPFGEPPKSSANFAWLQLAWTRLSENGTAMMIAPLGAAWSKGRESEIRKKMITEGALLGIIALPPNLFTHTAIPVHIWMLARDKSRHLPVDDANAVLFIDASRLGARAPRQSRVLTTEDLERISSRFRLWRNAPGETPDEPGFSRSVTDQEILENDGNLDPRLYVGTEQERTAPSDMSRLLGDLDRRGEATSRASEDLRKSFSMGERLIRGSDEPLSVPLRSIVDGRTVGVFEESTPGQLLAGPSGSHIHADDYVAAGGVPVVMPKDLTGNGFSTASIRYVSERQARSLERFRLRRGDVVLARRGELGRCAVAREEQHGWICGTGCFVLRPPAYLDADYFAAYLRGPAAREWLEAHATGMTMKTISLNVLGEMPVVLPDLGTQQAIADVMNRLDEHERLLREQLALTREIRADALNELLTS
jgi:type I restriction enzyme M protein